MADNKKQVTFKGSVIRCVYDSDSFKTYALDVDIKKYNNIKKNRYDNVSIIGELPKLTLGVEYEVIANEETSKYGISYRVINIKRDVPTTAEDTLMFLQEILTLNQAIVLYENYPDIIDRVKENRLDDIDLNKLHGIGEYTFNVIKNKIVDSFMLVDLVAEFKGVLSISMIKRIYDKYSSVEMLREKLVAEPYATLTRVSGIGFKTADSIVMDLQNENIVDFGYDIKTSADRCLSCIIYLLQENEDEGHTKMNLADLRKQCMQLVPECADNFVDVIKSDDIYYNKNCMEVSLKETYLTELNIAKTIVCNVVNGNNVWDFDVEKYRNVGEFELSDEQMKAVENVCKYNISILNGAAGTGKTQSTLAIINMLKDNNKRFRLFSPTGKAAKVLSEYTGERASTIHRGLGYTPPFSWTFGVDNKLYTDVVIIDEFSMVDIQLFMHVIDAIDFTTTKLLMIGDNAQLPSVSCGNLLHDFMESGVIPVATLTKVFRYGEGGLMTVATDVRYCKSYLNNSMKGNVTSFGSNKDYTFIDLASEDIPKNAVALYKKLLNKGNSIKNIQVLTAKNVGDCGTIMLNNEIQKVANRNYGSDTFMKIGGTTYYKGDLVIQKVNNYDAELYDVEDDDFDFSDKKQTAFVANGENGVIEEIYNQFVVINFDGLRVKYYRETMNMVGLGYAITIHKSQGSSIDNVILCTPQSHTFMLNSNLIYVGLTRMKKNCFHLGALSTVNNAIHKKANLTRHTFMQQLLINMYNNINKQSIS